MKYIFLRYSIWIKGQDPLAAYKDAVEKRYYDSPYIPLNVGSEIGEELWKSMRTGMQSADQMPEPYKTMMERMKGRMPPNVKGQYDESIKSVSESLSDILRKKERFEFALKSSAEHVQKNQSRFDVRDRVTSLFNQDSSKFADFDILPNFSNVIVSVGAATAIYYDYLSRLLGMAPWLMIHTTASRYPEQRYDFQNLKLYRQNPHLQGQLKYLAARLRSLHEQVDSFFDSIQTMRKWGLLF